MRIAAFRTFASGDLIPGESCENGSGDFSALLDVSLQCKLSRAKYGRIRELRRFVSESILYLHQPVGTEWKWQVVHPEQITNVVCPKARNISETLNHTVPRRRPPWGKHFHPSRYAVTASNRTGNHENPFR